MQPNQVNYNPTTPIQNLLPVFSSGQPHQQCQTFGRMNGMDVVAIQAGKSLLSKMRPTQEPWKSGYPQYHQAKTELLWINHAMNQHLPQADFRQQEIANHTSQQPGASNSAKRVKSKPFECNLCERKSVSINAIYAHFRRLHPELASEFRSNIHTDQTLVDQLKSSTSKSPAN